VLTYPTTPPSPIRLADLPPATTSEQEERLAAFRDLADRGTGGIITWRDGQGLPHAIYVDLFTACQVCIVLDRLDPDTRALMLRMEPDSLVRVAHRVLQEAES
jgi:hypothetical protein